MIRELYHYAHAVEKRLFQVYELSVLPPNRCHFSKDFYFRILRNPGATEDWVNLARFLGQREHVLLVDIGANVGEFTSDFLSFYKNGRSICFEPVKATFRLLSNRFANDTRVALNHCALNDFDGPAKINVHADNTLSSLTRFGEEANRYYKTEALSSEETQCRTLDGLHIQKADGESLFVKVDVQGLEKEVLRGAPETLARTDVVLIECSFADEYANAEPSFPEVCRMLHDCGLYPVIFQDFGRNLSNYAFERDVLFVRREILGNIWLNNRPAR